MNTLTALTWQDLVGRDLVGRDLLISPDSDSTNNQLRGPIKSLKIVEKSREWSKVKDKYLVVELEWIAYRRNSNQPWIFFADFTYPLSYDCIINYTSGPDVSLQSISWGARKHFKILTEGNALNRSNVLTEYYVEVHVRHSLYPPYPRDIELFGTSHNVEPKNPEKQDDVTVAAITFAVPADSFEAAQAWCRAECERHGLPVISMKQTRLYPSH